MGGESSLGIAGPVLGAFGAIESGKAQADELRRKAQMAKYAAALALQTGAIGAGRAMTQGSGIIGQAKVGAAASGIDVQSGAVQDTIGKTRMMSALDAATIRNNALRAAYGYKMQAAADLTGASNAEFGGYVNAMSTLIGGGAQVYSGYKAANAPDTEALTSGSAPYYLSAPGNPYDPATLPTFGRG